MAAEIPTGFSGGWNGNWSTRIGAAFNDTVPTTTGRASNRVLTFTNQNMGTVTRWWYDDSPLHNVVQGCDGICKLKLQAPALFTTSCTTHVRPINVSGNFDWKTWLSRAHAPPFEAAGFVITTNLVVSGEREVINLVTGFAPDLKGCEGDLNYTICTLEPGIGLYDVTVDDGLAKLDAPYSPELVAMANNTAVDNTVEPSIAGHTSTLAGIVNQAWVRYDSLLAFYPKGKVADNFFFSDLALEQFIKPSTELDQCQSYIDPREEVMTSLNKLMVYMGAYSATGGVGGDAYMPYVKANMDAGVHVKNTVTGYRQGSHNVFQTNYYFFLAAAIIEFVCIALIAPT